MMANDNICMMDLWENPDPRLSLCLCLDTSGSMNSVTGGRLTGRQVVVDGKVYNEVTGGSRSRLQILQHCLEEFYDAIFEDFNARYAVEIGIVTFDNQATMVQDFSRVAYNQIRERPPKLIASGNTAMGEGVNLALDMLEKRKMQYQQNGVEDYQPCLILITDGGNNGSPEAMARAKQRMDRLVDGKYPKLAMFVFYIGDDDDWNDLRELSPVQKPVKIGANQMKGMFRWLAKHVTKVTANMDLGCDNTITLSPHEIMDWEETLD